MLTGWYKSPQEKSWMKRNKNVVALNVVEQTFKY